jgi:3-(3-hydroxy-phenyl)propionate hydroxylase
VSVRQKILISGAGPVGLLCALALARRGIPVTVFERFDDLQDDPRAATTHPATLEALDTLDLVPDITAAGLVARTFQFWDRPSGELIAEFDHALLADETAFPYVVQTEQFKTARIALAHLRAHPNAEVLFGHEIIGVTQDEDSVAVQVRSEKGVAIYGGEWLIGADGGRSFTRKAAAIPFTGFTFPEQFVVFTTPFDFQAERGYSFRSYFADPDEWCNCFKVAANGPPGLWRTVFPADPDGNEETLLNDEAAQKRLHKFFPRAHDYELVHRNLYRVHQRVAQSFRAGRILLAGDSAHLNNPIGGMGLNGGIQDAVNLCDKLAQIWLHCADHRLLDLYDLQRRTMATEFVQAQSIENKKRLEAKDPETRAGNFAGLRAISRDPIQAKAFLMRSSMLAPLRQTERLALDDSWT